MTFDVPTLDHALLVGAGVLLLAILAVRLSVGVGFPSLLVYLLIGVAIGDSGIGVHFSNVDVAYALGFAALMIILAEGGLTTPWKQIKPVLKIGFALATVGVGVSIAIVAVLTHYLLDLDWRTAVLLGAVCSPTDAAAVFSMLRRVPLPRRITATLEAESGLNDAPTVVIVTLVSTHVSGFGWISVGTVVYELVAGVALGYAIGWLGAQMMKRVALPSSGLYPTAVMAIAVLGYAGPAFIHASGFAGVYVATLVLGNSDLPHRAATRSFAEGLAWLAQIGLFVMLGVMSSPARLNWSEVGTALAAGVILTLVARPISVALSSLVQPMPWREAAFISWAGLRGAVPIVLAMIPLASDVPGSQRLWDVVFVLVVVFTLITGPTLPVVAQVLKVARRSEPRDLDVEAAPLEKIAADLLQVQITPESLLHGVEVCELRLPKGASVSLVVRDGQSMVPEQRTVLRHGDDLLVVTPRAHREATEQRLREVSIGGRLAGWLSSSKPRRRP